MYGEVEPVKLMFILSYITEFSFYLLPEYWDPFRLDFYIELYALFNFWSFFKMVMSIRF